MEDIKQQKIQIIKKLKEINEQLTDDIIENATKEEMEQYIDLIDTIIARLKTIDMIEENN